MERTKPLIPGGKTSIIMVFGFWNAFFAHFVWTTHLNRCFWPPKKTDHLARLGEGRGGLSLTGNAHLNDFFLFTDVVPKCNWMCKWNCICKCIDLRDYNGILSACMGDTRGKGSIMTTKVLFAQRVVPLSVHLPTMMMVIDQWGYHIYIYKYIHTFTQFG